MMLALNNYQIKLRGRRVDYRLVLSRSAKKVRVRVGLNGVEVVKPINRTDADILEFLDRNEKWIFDQLRRVDRLRKISVTHRKMGEILFRGEPTRIRIQEVATKSRGN